MYHISETYEQFKKDFPDIEISKKDYRIIATGFCKYLKDRVVDGDFIRLPFSTGSLRIVGLKQKLRRTKNGILNKPVNWKETRELWRSDPQKKEQKVFIHFDNLHTNGILYRYIWGKRNAFIHMKDMYQLKMCRQAKKDLSNCVLNGKEYGMFNN